MRRTNNNYRKVLRQTLLEMYKRIDYFLYSVPIGSNLDEDENDELMVPWLDQIIKEFG